jgi:hypothetical protein
MTQFSSLYAARLDEELGTDDNSVLFTTARRKSAINKGMTEFAELTECLVRQSTVILTGGTAEYDLNSTTVIASGDFVRLAKQQVEFRYVDASSNLTILTGDDLPRRDIDWLNRYTPGWQTSTVASSVMQTPTSYYERMDGGSRYLGFAPVPSTGSSASMTAIVPYIARPVLMTSDTNEPFQVGAVVRTDLRDYQQALVHFAAHQLEKLRRDDAASDRQLQKFLGYVTRFFQNTRIKGGLSLTMARNYFKTRATAQDPRT